MDWAFWLMVNACILAVCRAIDFFLLNSQHETLVLKLLEFEERLSQIAIREWQGKIARAATSFWSNSPRRLLEALYRIQKKHPATFVIIFLFAFVPGVEEVLEVIRGRHTITLIYVMSMQVGTIAVALRLFHTRRLVQARILRTNLVMCLSFTATYIALRIGEAVSSPAIIAVITGSDQRQELKLGFLNLIFDASTILVSLTLLRWVVRNHNRFVFAAALDMASSATFSILLRSLIFPGDGLPGLLGWLDRAIRLNTSEIDLAITPLLITTFIPVACYSSALILLGLVLKPLLKVSLHICRVLCQEDKIPFTAAGLTLSSLLIAFKAVQMFLDG